MYVPTEIKLGLTFLPYLLQSPFFLKKKINETVDIARHRLPPYPSSPQVTELKLVFHCPGHVLLLSSYAFKTCNSIVTPIFKVYIDGIILYVVLCRLLFSLCIMFWRLIHTGTRWSSSFILTAIDNFIVLIKQLIFLFLRWEADRLLLIFITY